MTILSKYHQRFAYAVDLMFITYQMYDDESIQVFQSFQAFQSMILYMGVSKNRGGPPKWMVYNGENLLLKSTHHLGGNPSKIEWNLTKAPREK